MVDVALWRDKSSKTWIFSEQNERGRLSYPPIAFNRDSPKNSLFI